MDRHLKVTEEQIAYGRLLDSGMKIGFVALLVTFAAYVSGLLQPSVPLQDVSRYWGLSVHDYLIATGNKPGWAWLHLLHKGDFLNFVGIAFLAGITAICYVRIIPILLRKKDTVFAILAVVEVIVLSLAASGLLRGGGH
jgi:hypothetical protein